MSTFLGKKLFTLPQHGEHGKLATFLWEFLVQALASCSLILVLKNRKDPHWALSNETMEP